MIILGITAFQHDSAACVLVDGKLVAAAEEERFSRKKHDGGFPYGAIDYCLNEIGASINDVAWVAFCINPWLNLHRKRPIFALLLADGKQQIVRNGLPADVLHIWLSSYSSYAML